MARQFRIQSPECLIYYSIVRVRGPFPVFIHISQWIVKSVVVTIPRLRVSSLNTLAGRINAGEASLGTGVVPGAEVIEAGFVVPFFLG